MKLISILLFLSLNILAKEASDFQINSKLSLASIKDKYVVLEWYNENCPFVKKHYDSNNMQTIKSDLMKKGIIWISIISSAPGKQGHIGSSSQEAQLKKIGSNYLVLDPSGKIGKAYGAKTTPHMFIIKNMKVLYQGAIDSTPSADSRDIPKSDNYIKLAFNNLFSNKDVKVASTKAYGCSVKY